LIRIRANGNRLAHGIKKFTVDTFDEIAKINLAAVAMGSIAFVIDTSETYMLNGSRVWVKVTLSGGSSGGSSGSGDIIYDGGLPGDDNTDPDDVIYEGGII